MWNMWQVRSVAETRFGPLERGRQWGIKIWDYPTDVCVYRDTKQSIEVQVYQIRCKEAGINSDTNKNFEMAGVQK